MGLENFILGFFEFIGNIDFNVFTTFFFIVLFIFWLVLAGWVWIDSGERTSNVRTRIIYLLLIVILNIPGLVIYLIIRPSETIEEIYWEDLERRYLKYETAGLGDCPECGTQLFPGYNFCINCGYEVKRKCPNCDVMIERTAGFCPHCGTKIDRAQISEEENYPSIEVMEQQVLATKEEAAETVKLKRLKYKSSSSFATKLGGSIISVWNSVVKQNDKSKDIVEKENTKKESKRKKKKRKKRIRK